MGQASTDPQQSPPLGRGESTLHEQMAVLDERGHWRRFVMDLGNEAHRSVMSFPVRVSAIAYAAGHVFFVQDREVFARPFDPMRLEFTGPATRVLQGIPVVANGRAPGRRPSAAQ